MDGVARFVIRFRRWIIALFIVLTVLFAIPLRNAQIDSDVQNILPPDMPEQIHLKELEKEFGGMEMAIVMVTAPDVLAPAVRQELVAIAHALRGVEGVERVHTIPDLEPDPLDEPPTEQELRERIKNNPMIYGRLIAKDFTAAAIVLQLPNNGKEYLVTNEIRRRIQKTAPKAKVYYGGMPFIRESISRDVPHDMMIFLPVGLLIMILFLFISFRQLRGVLLPFAVVVMSIVFSMGLVPLLGWKMMTVTVLLPVILLAIANDYGIHLISQYQLDNTPGKKHSAEELAKKGLLSLGTPIIFTGVTTIAGMLCLVIHTLVPASQMGWLAAAGILFALLASLLFIPAVLATLPVAQPIIKADPNKRHILDRILSVIARFEAHHPRKILLFFLILTAIVASGIAFIHVDSNLVSYYPKGHEVRESAKIVDSKFGGAQIVAIKVEGDILSPKLLRTIDSVEKQIAALPHVGNTISVARLVRLMSTGFIEKGQKGYNAIPPDKKAVEWYFDNYKKMGDASELKTLVNDSFTAAQITVQITSTSSEVMRGVVKQIKKIIAGDPHFTTMSGSAVVFSALMEKVVWGQIATLLLSLLVISLLVSFLFRSFVAGLLSLIPLAVSLLLLFGIMGYSGIPLDIVTTMLSSIVVGVGVDYTIHFLWKYKEERAKGNTPRQSVDETLRTAGRGIIFNAFSVMVGFIVLFFSAFLPIRFFGFLIILSIGMSLVGALIVLPAIVVVFRPRFLEPKKNG